MGQVSSLEIVYPKLIFPTGLTLVASSCKPERVTLPWSGFAICTHTHTHTHTHTPMHTPMHTHVGAHARCFVCRVYWQFPTWQGNKKEPSWRHQDNYCLVDISHPSCVQMLWLRGASFCLLSHGIGLGKSSSSLSSPVISCHCRWHREAWTLSKNKPVRVGQKTQCVSLLVTSNR